MKPEELREKQNKLLDGSKLNDHIEKLIKMKGFNAKCAHITTIAGRDGRNEIVIELFIDVLNSANIAHVYLYITEDVFDPDCFTWIDSALDVKDKQISIDNFILLRALRVVYSVIKNIRSGFANAVDVNKIIYVRTYENGLCDYHN